MMLGMVIFWVAVAALVVWRVRGRLTSRGETPDETLRRRLAEGSISVGEYEQRRAALNAQPESAPDRVVGRTAHGHA